MPKEHVAAVMSGGVDPADMARSLVAKMTSERVPGGGGGSVDEWAAEAGGLTQVPQFSDCWIVVYLPSITCTQGVTHVPHFSAQPEIPVLSLKQPPYSSHKPEPICH